MADAYINRGKDGRIHRHCRACREQSIRHWRAQNRSAVHVKALSYADVRNERRWRFKMWEMAHMRPEHKEMLESMTFTNPVELTCPLFVIVEPNGHRRKESLNEPLPKWK